MPESRDDNPNPSAAADAGAKSAAVAERIEDLARALDAAPLDAGLHARMLAAAHELALAAFAMLGEAPREQLALVLYNVATVYAIKGRREAAIRWYRHTLDIDAGLAIAHQNLAVALEREGQREASAFHRERAYRLQRVFVDGALGEEQRRVLILGAGKGTGNVPIDTLLSRQTTARIRYAIDYAGQAEDAQLPPYDLVFNGIGDPDIAAPLAARLARFSAACERPVLNRPEAIERTHRHKTAALLADLDDVIVPPCVRLDARPASAEALASQLAKSGVAFPVLMRPLAMHGGDNLERHASLDSLWRAIVDRDAPCYLNAFYDFRSPDGYYRKYRVIYVDREAYPYHLAISPHWMVHYFSAGMLEAQWKLDEERRFLADPSAALGKRASNAIAAIGRRLDLEYGGVDFTLTPKGEVLVFEANATMLTHGEAVTGPLAHKNAYVGRIIEAFEKMVRARLLR
ncbi:tetratricopeptide repeat protein [Paraburkholderia sp. J41]|uniref:ATP-grasp domain-containing protein n=1 Tax=Paraburkholderia sp. J41 TaxID=2805433 RepID=UPI002AC31986|nr:tetratricopeptide repeat protein [Paraburkholderia sp. J41]